MTDAAEIAEKTPAQLLYDACKAGDAEAVRAAPADVAVAAKSDAGKPALAAAAEAQHGAVVDALLAHGVADGASAGFWSAAMYAAWNGDAAILGALLKAGGGGVPAVDACGLSALMLAALKDRIECVALLLHADPKAIDAADAQGRTALMHAAIGGAVEAVKLLAARGAAVDAAGAVDGKTALMWAVVAHKPAAVEALCALGCDPDARELPPVDPPVVPGKSFEVGETAAEMAEAEAEKDAVMRHIAKYLKGWHEMRGADPAAKAPPMAELEAVAHAEDDGRTRGGGGGGRGGGGGGGQGDVPSAAAATSGATTTGRRSRSSRWRRARRRPRRRRTSRTSTRSVASEGWRRGGARSALGSRPVESVCAASVCAVRWDVRVFEIHR